MKTSGISWIIMEKVPMAFGEPKNLKKRRIVLTGASRGIGRVSALRLAKAGAKVFAVSRDAEALAKLAFDSKGYVGHIFPHSCDVTKADEVEALREMAEKRLEGVDTLINNAGSGVFKDIENLSVDEFNATVSVCLTAPFMLTRALCPLLAAANGEVINISSISAVSGFPGASAYCAAKAGLEGLSRALVEELRPKGIRLTILRPGACATDMWKSIPGEFDVEAMIPPDLVAEAIEFLLSQSRRAWTESMVVLPPKGMV